MIKTAIVTGASSGIGLEVSKSLINLGYKVYGFGRDFSKIDFANNNFIEIVCDLMKIEDVSKEIKAIRKSEDVYILVNNAGVGYFGLHEELNSKKIHEMVVTNIEAPMVLTQLLLRDLKKNKGFIINISSVTAKMSSTHGCVYGATKAALTHFSNSLFDEARKYGVKVLSMHPDMTKTNFYRNADFREGEYLDSYIMPEEVAKIIEMVVTQREGVVLTDITLKAEKHSIRRKNKI